MSDTKENILTTALRLFAQKGYDAVSVSEIAGELGMTKGALYKHYRNKRDIFDSIVKRMYKVDAERSRQYNVPEQKYESAPTAYNNLNIEDIKRFTIAQYEFWTEDNFASDFRKMLSLEQYRNPEMAELYNSCLVKGPIEYLQDMFKKTLLKEPINENEAEKLALEFYAPMYLLIALSDNSHDKKKLSQLLNDHIEKFIQKTIGDKNEIYKK